jgi:hypothetical protein
MGKRKGLFSRKGVGETVWGKKTTTLTVTLSEQGKDAIKARAKELNLSFSEIAERWGRSFQVDFGAAPLPAELDSASEIVAVMSVVELSKALTLKLQEQQSEDDIKVNFIRGVANGSVSFADTLKVAELLDLEDKEAEALVNLAKLLKGEKRTNGV